MKFLFIDDSAIMLGAWQRAFNQPNVAFAECHSVEEALHAIAEHKPDVIFLDHSLGRRGDEGLEIAKRAGSIKIYSTSSALEKEVKEEYRRIGVEWIGKNDFEKLCSIINLGGKVE